VIAGAREGSTPKRAALRQVNTPISRVFTSRIWSYPPPQVEERRANMPLAKQKRSDLYLLEDMTR
jgi:hypothetical protein